VAYTVIIHYNRFAVNRNIWAYKYLYAGQEHIMENTVRAGWHMVESHKTGHSVSRTAQEEATARLHTVRERDAECGSVQGTGTSRECGWRHTRGPHTADAGEPVPQRHSRGPVGQACAWPGLLPRETAPATHGSGGQESLRLQRHHVHRSPA